jgi:hypothetical protein
MLSLSTHEFTGVQRNTDSWFHTTTTSFSLDRGTLGYPTKRESLNASKDRVFHHSSKPKVDNDLGIWYGDGRFGYIGRENDLQSTWWTRLEGIELFLVVCYSKRVLPAVEQSSEG